MWIDPQVVIVAVRIRKLRERFTGVSRLPHAIIQYPARVRVARVSVDMNVVPRPSAQRLLLAHALPRFAAVVRAEQRPILRLHQSPDALRPSRRNGDADLPDPPARQAGAASDVHP